MTEDEKRKQIDDRLKALELAMAQIDRQLGKGSVVRLGNDKIEPWPSIPTGAISLDLALGIGGLPKGRIVEIYGPESSGKSTIALSVVAQAQQAGGVAAYVDVEHALDPIYMKALGVNLDDLLLSQPSTGEDAIHIVETLVRTGNIDVIVVDSVAALVTKAELDGDITEFNVGGQARLMSKAMRKLNGIASDTKTCIIFINQLREKIGVMFGSPEITSGGKALKFYSSIRMDVRKKDDVKDNDGQVIGQRSKVKVIKNKMAPAYRMTEFNILYGHGIDTIRSAFDVATDFAIIKKSGVWYSYNDQMLGQGAEKSCLALAADLDVLYEIQAKILDHVAK